MYKITKTIIRLDNHEAEVILYKCPDSKELHFLQDFQARHALDLEFESYQSILSFMDNNNTNERQMVITGNDLYYPIESKDRVLAYFGTIEEL